jgi:gliding motility-associated-like protein
VEVADIEIQTEPVVWYSGDLHPMDDFEVVIGEGDITSFDVCDPLVYPTPDFSLPDTVCQFSCLQPTDLNNQLANSVTWIISGPGLDTVVQDTSFQHCFDVPGTYYFDHQVWVLGCFTQQYDTLVVLPDDLYTTIGDTLACDFPLSLYLPASRLLQDADWSHGAVGVEVQIDTPGIYSFLATDGYCSVQDTIRVSDIYEQYPLPWLWPVDTTICSADFPFRLAATSPYTGIFRLDGQIINNTAALSEPGNYQLELELNNCTEWTTIALDSIDCTARIYLPNAFSPNDDGHNDRWFPQGYNFEPLQLQIFNRWGGLVYDDHSGTPVWNGRVHGQLAETGVYLATFRYYNPLRNEEGQVTQEVVLLR